MAAVSIVPGGRAVARESRQRVSVIQSYNFSGVPYEGPYEADARFIEQTFGTAHKTMASDFSVHAINYTEAPNESGITVTIGG